MPHHVTTHRIRFNDTDRLGHVNNAVFAVLLEQGRTEMLSASGMPVGTADGFSVVIVRLELDFVREMTWPGDVRVETALARLGTRSFTLAQSLQQDGEVTARAQTVLVVMDRAARKAAALTEAQRAALGAWQAAPA